jgi:hypothetical protein
MKLNKILTVAVAATVLSGAGAMAQLNYQSGDLLVGFGQTGAAKDVIVNLGSIANYQIAYSSYTNDLSGVLTAAFGGVTANLYWSVFGVTDLNNAHLPGISQGGVNTIWNTSTTANRTVPGDDTVLVTPFNQIKTLVNVSLVSPVNYAPGIITVGSGTVDGFSSQMLNNGGAIGTFNNTWGYNMGKKNAGNLDLLQNDGSNAGNTAQMLGIFNLNSAGVLTFNAVPEPSTWAMMGSGVLALLALRRRNK